MITEGRVCAAGKIEAEYTNRTKQVSSFIVMDILKRHRKWKPVAKISFHLEIGEPDFDTPQPVKEAALQALSSGDTHYTHSLGKLALRGYCRLL